MAVGNVLQIRKTRNWNLNTFTSGLSTQKMKREKRNADFQGFIFYYTFLHNPNYLKNYFPHTHTYFTSNVIIEIKFASWSSENQKDL